MSKWFITYLNVMGRRIHEEITDKQEKYDVLLDEEEHTYQKLQTIDRSDAGKYWLKAIEKHLSPMNTELKMLREKFEAHRERDSFCRKHKDRINSLFGEYDPNGEVPTDVVIAQKEGRIPSGPIILGDIILHFDEDESFKGFWQKYKGSAIWKDKHEVMRRYDYAAFLDKLYVLICSNCPPPSAPPQDTAMVSIYVEDSDVANHYRKKRDEEYLEHIQRMEEIARFEIEEIARFEIMEQAIRREIINDEYINYRFSEWHLLMLKRLNAKVKSRISVSSTRRQNVHRVVAEPVVVQQQQYRYC